MAEKAYTREEFRDLVIKRSDRIQASAMAMLSTVYPEARFTDAQLSSEEAVASTEPIVIFRIEDFGRLLREYTRDVVTHAAAATVGAVWNDDAR